MSVSQKDIAQKLNLSVATVSRCLQDDPGMSPETRSLVQSAAARAGYKRKTAPRPPTPERATPMLAVLIQSDSLVLHHQGANLLAGMSQGAKENNASLVFHMVPLDKRPVAHEEENLPEILRHNDAAAIVLMHEYPAEVVRAFAARAPVVSPIYDYPGESVYCVAAANDRAMECAVDALFQRGHRRIAFVDDAPQRSLLPCSPHRERLAGCIAALLMRGYRTEDLVWVRPERMDGARADLSGLQTALDRGVTALVCGFDRVAYDAIHWLRARSLRVPEDLSVIGFDALEVPEGFPPVASFRVPDYEIGRHTVSLILSHAPMMPRRRDSLECVFVPGETLAPVRPSS